MSNQLLPKICRWNLRRTKIYLEYLGKFGQNIVSTLKKLSAPTPMATA